MKKLQIINNNFFRFIDVEVITHATLFVKLVNQYGDVETINQKFKDIATAKKYVKNCLRSTNEMVVTFWLWAEDNKQQTLYRYVNTGYPEMENYIAVEKTTNDRLTRHFINL